MAKARAQDPQGGPLRFFFLFFGGGGGGGGAWCEFSGSSEDLRVLAGESPPSSKGPDNSSTEVQSSDGSSNFTGSSKPLLSPDAIPTRYDFVFVRLLILST